MKFVFFDLETTGCPQSGAILHDYHRIVQISAVCGENTFDAVVNPQCHIPSESTAIHRVTDDVASQFGNFGTVFPGFRSFIKKQTQGKRGTQVVLVAHNAFGFDKQMLEKECGRFGLRIPATWKFYDTLLKYRGQFPELSSKRLGDIYKERFKEELTGAHDSLADSLALKRLFELDIAQHFDMNETLAVHEQQYLDDRQDVLAVRGIGEKTRYKIARAMQIANPTIGDLRNAVNGHSLADLETFIRTQLACHKEQFCFSILCEIVRPQQPHLLFKSFPFVQHTFTSVLPEAVIETLITKYRIRSAEQLKRHYLFKLNESGVKWDQLLEELKVNSFTVSMMMRSI